MNKVFVTAIVKDVPAEEYGHYLPPMKARRMGKLQKRALVTALKAMEISGVGEPDAILNGTAMGCMENTVQMLCGLASEGEEVNMPTCFMQSTHNTVASMIAIYTKNHDELTALQLQNPNFFGQLEVCDRSESWMLSVEPGETPLYELENVQIIHKKGVEDRAVIQLKPL